MADDRKDQNALDAEARERAEKAGVVAPQFVDYDEALKNYQDRDDTETLESRRAREVGSSTRHASHVREGNLGGVVTAGETKGNTSKDAPVPDKSKDEK